MQCDGKVALTEPADLHRPLLAGVLQSAWGVAPSHLSWGEPQNRSVADHLFSVGNTPFGHLAAAAGPSLVGLCKLMNTVDSFFVACKHPVSTLEPMK